MKSLYDAETDVTEQLKANRSSDSEIVVVLSAKNAPKYTMPCGRHIITVFNEIQKSAGAMKQFGYPNIIITQTSDDVPQNIKQVQLMKSVFHEQLAVNLETIRHKFENPSLHNPFMLVDGKLVNMYGPKRQPFKLDPAGHGSLHEKLETVMEDFVRENKTKNFTKFQTLVEGVIYSKYCSRCLGTILSYLKTLDNVVHFVSNLSGGIRSPICTKEMKLCSDWVDDQGKRYQQSCWRYPDAMKSVHSTARGSPTSNEEVSVEKSDSEHIDRQNFSQDEINKYFPEFTSSSESSEDEEESSNQTTSKAVKEFTKKEMFNAFLALDNCLKKHKSKLPVKRWTDHLFCVFCFKFHSTPWHECENLNEAEIKASEELCRLIEGKFAIDLELFENLKEFVCSQLDRYAEVQKPAVVTKKALNPNRAIRSGVPIESKKPSPVVEEESAAQPALPTQPVVASRLAKRTGVPVKVKKQAIKKNGSGAAVKPTSTKSKFDLSVVPYSSKGNNSLHDASPPKRHKKNSGAGPNSVKGAIDGRKENTAEESIPRAEYVSPLLPADRSTWTREHHIMHIYGPSYQALMPFNPMFSNPGFHPGNNSYFNNGFMGMNHAPNIFGYQPNQYQEPNNTQVITIDDDDDLPVALN